MTLRYFLLHSVEPVSDSFFAPARVSPGKLHLLRCEAGQRLFYASRKTEGLLLVRQLPAQVTGGGSHLIGRGGNVCRLQCDGVTD